MLSAEKNCQQLSDDDAAFWSFVKPDQRPKTVAEAYMNQDEDSEDQISDEEEEEEDMDVELISSKFSLFTCLIDVIFQQINT